MSAMAAPRPEVCYNYIFYTKSKYSVFKKHHPTAACIVKCIGAKLKKYFFELMDRFRGSL